MSDDDAVRNDVVLAADVDGRCDSITQRCTTRQRFTLLGYRVFMTMGSMYVLAASVIGFETLALLLGFATMAPIAVPFVMPASRSGRSCAAAQVGRPRCRMEG